MHSSRSLVLLGALGVAACVEAPITTPPGELNGALAMASVQGTKSYVIIGKQEKLPESLSDKISAAGGTLTADMSVIGVASASSSDPNFATNAASALNADIVEDLAVGLPNQQLIPAEVGDLGEPTFTQTASVGAGEQLRLVQWAPDAVHAPGAWDLGFQGQGARVAVIDGGIHSTHVDLVSNLDVAHSTSFYPSCILPGTKTEAKPCPFNVDAAGDSVNSCILDAGVARPDAFWHGTHVAGIVAAAAQGPGAVGIAPKATIIGVKALHCGGGLFSYVINAMIYAATPIAAGGAGAHIINMSLGALIPRGPTATDKASAFAHLFVVLSRAAMYARRNNVTVIAAAGNESADLDHTADLMSVPAQSVDVISVAATGPLGWALGANDFDRPASYTNFGQSAINFAAPGGGIDLFLLRDTRLCARPLQPSGAIVRPCFVFDWVLSTTRSTTAGGNWGWTVGTSMAAPVVSGVAALIVGKYNGNISPAGVERILRQSADDLGKPGNDDFYGGGRVNALKAVQ
ncbi:MAG TPA: S8 family serine peptidase [Gemmatimonadaceae bacterium]|nr:S8 family serine peptidase [Gemmatimonadaceae bacterium]